MILHEIRNSRMKEFVNKLGITIQFTPTLLPWSNRVNERNYHNFMIVRNKIEKKMNIVLVASPKKVDSEYKSNNLSYWPSGKQGAFCVMPK